jgi:hypothetical protein
MKKAKPYWKMTTDALRKATRQFDDPTYQPPALQPPPEELAKHRRAQNKGGRPRKGLGAKVISLTVERGLLARSDAYAKQIGISRAQLIERGLKAIVPAQMFSRKRAG